MAEGLKKMKDIRSISMILIDADNAVEPKVLSDCWNEIAKNKYSYSLAQLTFAKEHLESLSRKLARQAIEENKELFKAWKGFF
ncbi:MAG: hypothetical protein ACRBFS_19570 [Aureispira sp.]